MSILKITEDLICEYDEKTLKSKLYCASNLEQQIKDCKERLAQIPEEPSDEILLAWARENYPRIDYSKEKETLAETLEKATQLLAETKGK